MENPRNILIFTLAIAAFFTFAKLGQHPISPWDEARNAVNAIEMQNNGDWFNLHYAGQPDTWNTKPPFFAWCVSLSFRAFGFNEFALRLPSALAITLAFFFIFKIITLYQSSRFALFTCLILVSVKGLIGWHVGRSGDFDAMLVFCLLAGVYFFLRWLDFEKRWDVLWAGLFFGLAFWVKGPACAVLLPGLFLYAWLRAGQPFRKFVPMTRDGKVESLAAAALFLLFPLAWFLVNRIFGVAFQNNEAGGNAFERLFLYDLLERFTQAKGDTKSAFDPSFFFYSLDKSFNLWQLVFFGWLLFGLFHLIKNRRRILGYLLHREQNRLLLLSLCLYFPLAVFLSLAAKSNTWYLAPALPFVGIATTWGIWHFWQKHRAVKYLFFALLAFTLGRRLLEIWSPKAKPAFVLEHRAALANAPVIVQAGIIEQDVLLYLYFQNRNLVFAKKPEDWQAGALLFIDRETWQAWQPALTAEILAKTEKYVLAKN